MVNSLKGYSRKATTKKANGHKSELITKDSNLAELVVEYPQLAETLFEDYGLHCVGCFASAFDTLESGAQIHGMSDREIAAMVKRLNELSKKRK